MKSELGTLSLVERGGTVNLDPSDLSRPEAPPMVERGGGMQMIPPTLCSAHLADWVIEMPKESPPSA